MVKLKVLAQESTIKCNIVIENGEDACIYRVLDKQKRIYYMYVHIFYIGEYTYRIFQLKLGGQFWHKVTQEARVVM